MNGPSWLGIGAQRCGTTWFTDLLLQHPSVTLSQRDRKELHELYMSDLDEDAYRELFRDCDGKPGEWTPFYLRAPWAAPVAARVLLEAAPVLVLLRDPVERFASAMRHESRRRTMGSADRKERHRLLRSDAVWAGMYATQLEAWEQYIGRDRIVVLQYEQVVLDPQRWVNEVWAMLGLSPVALNDVEARSRTSTDHGAWQWPEGVQETLRRCYADEVTKLAAGWNIDPELWPSARRESVNPTDRH